MPAPETTTVAVTPYSFSENGAGGPIAKVLVLDPAANAALGALLADLENLAAHSADPISVPALGTPLAPNHVRDLHDLRRSAFGY